jgi:hypothetical protein
MEEVQFCPFNCPHLSTTFEAQQREKYVEKELAHYCNKYNQPVFHGTHHPNIIRVKNCTQYTETVGL